jgi:hypothetical protein
VSTEPTGDDEVIEDIEAPAAEQAHVAGGGCAKDTTIMCGAPLETKLSCDPQYPLSGVTMVDER